MKSNYITDKETSKGIKLKEKLYCNILVLDNFYNNPMETRNHILTQEFLCKRKLSRKSNKIICYK